ncbi:MAG TPA: ferritin-like domain-containing protein [Kofleriaceae bacterium]|nr:ferritin-like domain-containing protein [Kofleriaceae bacterium]
MRIDPATVPAVDPVVRRIPIADGTREDLEALLQAAVNLELWTIPLYLTALSSIQRDASHIALPPERARHARRSSTTVSRLLVSVALQEMYHLQLAGNIARMFGVVPRLDWPAYDGRIPYVIGLPAGVTVALGTANDVNTLRLMLAVETPDDPLPGHDRGERDVPFFPFIQYDGAGQPAYPSIGTLYSALLQLANRFRDQLQAGAPQLANGLFAAWYQHTGVLQPGSLGEAINIIVDQGEGAIGQQAAPIDDPAAIPGQGNFADPFYAENHFSHCERFQLCLDNATRGVTVWPTTSAAASSSSSSPAQQHVSVVFDRLLADLRAAWAGAAPSLEPMFLFRAALAQVYIAGEIPTFAPPAPGSPTYDASVAALAPATGARWASQVQFFFTITDIEGMKANHVSRVDLASQTSVAANQGAIAALAADAQMPPGELNVWSAAQQASFAGWKGD